MSEKHLTEQPWKTLIAKQGVKDIGLQKALAAYAKLDASKDPATVLEALKEIAELAAKLKKANSAKEEVVAHLDEVVKEVKKTTPAFEARFKTGAVSTAAAPAKPQAAPKPALEEEESDDANIKVRLLTALKKVKAAAGEESFAFVACVAKPFYGLLLAKSATEKMGTPHKKILADLTGGTKFIVGRCLFEDETHTFVVDPVPAGLAKRLKLAIKEFAGVARKVRVRDSEGKVVADGDTDVNADEDEAPAAAPEPPPSPPTSAPAASAEEMAKFTARFKALQKDLLKAIATKTPDGGEVKQRATEAGALAGKKDFAQAHRVLDAVEALLKKVLGTEVPPPAAAPPPPIDTAADGREAAHAKWQTARAAVIAQLKSLGDAIQATNDPEAGPAIVLVKAIQANLTAEPDTLKSVDELERYLQTDDIITEAESPNGFGVSVVIRKPLLEALSALKQQLRA